MECLRAGFDEVLALAGHELRRCRHDPRRLAGSADGTRLYWQAWEPDGAPRDTVILVHGAAEHGGRYAHVAERLPAEGYAVYALDHRGHGRSDGRAREIDRLDRLVEDLGLFVALRRHEPSRSSSATAWAARSRSPTRSATATRSPASSSPAPPSPPRPCRRR